MASTPPSGSSGGEPGVCVAGQDSRSGPNPTLNMELQPEIFTGAEVDVGEVNVAGAWPPLKVCQPQGQQRSATHTTGPTALHLFRPLLFDITTGQQHADHTGVTSECEAAHSSAG